MTSRRTPSPPPTVGQQRCTYCCGASCFIYHHLGHLIAPRRPGQRQKTRKRRGSKRLSNTLSCAVPKPCRHCAVPTGTRRTSATDCVDHQAIRGRSLTKDSGQAAPKATTTHLGSRSPMRSHVRVSWHVASGLNAATSFERLGALPSSTSWSWGELERLTPGALPYQGPQHLDKPFFCSQQGSLNRRLVFPCLSKPPLGYRLHATHSHSIRPPCPMRRGSLGIGRHLTRPFWAAMDRISCGSGMRLAKSANID
ncbi:hypothetical protein EV126DRAFT_134506 [Verticillium dahliae]|nr:hypothetical protein EV126DRAFT_134506 [Verticillium dahliae]